MTTTIGSSNIYNVAVFDGGSDAVGAPDGTGTYIMYLKVEQVQLTINSATRGKALLGWFSNIAHKGKLDITINLSFINLDYDDLSNFRKAWATWVKAQTLLKIYFKRQGSSTNLLKFPTYTTPTNETQIQGRLGYKLSFKYEPEIIIVNADFRRANA